MAIYRSGKASIDAAGKITGNGTKWADPLNMIARESTIVFYDNGTLRAASILDIESDTAMTSVNGDGIAVAETDYFILVNDATSIGGLSKQVSEALRYFQGKESTLQEFIDWIEDFDWAKFQRFHDEAKQYSEEAKDSADLAEQKANAASASQIAAAGSEANAKASETESARLEALSRTHAQDASGFKDEAMAQAERAKGYAESVKPETYLTKGGNLAGLANVNEARNNLNIGVEQDVLFGSVVASRNVSASWTDSGGMFLSQSLSPLGDLRYGGGFQAFNNNAGSYGVRMYYGNGRGGLQLRNDNDSFTAVFGADSSPAGGIYGTARSVDVRSARRVSSESSWCHDSSIVASGMVEPNDNTWGYGIISGYIVHTDGLFSTSSTFGMMNVANGWPATVINMNFDQDATKYRRYAFSQAGKITTESNDGGNFEFTRNPISDRRVKESIEYNDGADCYNLIKNMKPCTFVYSSKSRSNTTKRGFIAQDLGDIDEQYTTPVIDSSGESILSIDSNVLLLDTTAALKAAIGKIEALEVKIAVLEEKLNS